MAFVGLMEKG